jgi:Domain of unknown function (DUF4926)
MTKPELFDVIELLVDLPERQIKAGEIGTIVEKYDDCAYEVEFANSEGETLALLALAPETFMVVWKNETQDWVSLGDRIATMIKTLSEDRQIQVLEFTRTLQKNSA